jgi:hypothetical protein
MRPIHTVRFSEVFDMKADSSTSTRVCVFNAGGVTVRSGQRGERRGNTLVLVAAVLALLVIIATAYMSRTQSQRTVSVAQQSASMRSESVEAVAEKLAFEVAQSLFARPVDPNDPAMYDDNNDLRFPASSNFPRLRIPSNARRYGVDPNFPFNFAPYHTVPYTNWPTPETLWWVYGISLDAAIENLPAGPGNPGIEPNAIPGIQNTALAFESNQMGNPGFGDLRWLADAEPMRWVLPNGTVSFSHWRKLTNIAAPNNTWRVIGDISNVDRSIITDLTIPIEQWPAVFRPNREATIPPAPNPATISRAGDTSFRSIHLVPGGENMFLRQWAHWFGFDATNVADPFAQPADQPAILGYLTAYGRQGDAFGVPVWNGMPSNLMRLRNLHGFMPENSWIDENGVPQDRPESEFIFGTARHTVSRIMADTTGDGYTDAFWFDPGLPPRDGVRQIVAVRIEDNSSRLNAGVATRFLPWDEDGVEYKTRGHHPSDIALVGELSNPPGAIFNNNTVESLMGPTFNVGFYDTLYNWMTINSQSGPVLVSGRQDYRRSASPGATTPFQLWQRHVAAVGLVNPDGDLIVAPTIADRQDYWRRSGRHGLTYQPYSPYRQFSLADDLELRMFHGNNYSWIFSDFERSSHPTADQSPGFLRAAMKGRQEQLEYRLGENQPGQLTNRELVLDNRRKVTLYSGARNDQLPPWLWWENRYVRGWNLDQLNICDHVSSFNATEISAALPPLVRNLIANLCTNDITGVEANRAFRRFLAQSRQKLDLREYVNRYYFDDNGNRVYPNLNDRGRIHMRDRLAPMLMMALTDGPMVYQGNNLVYSSYFGDYVFVNPDGPGTPIDISEDDRRHYRNPKGNLNNTRRLAAAYASNILAYGSNDIVRLQDRILLPEHGYQFDVADNLEVVFAEGQFEAGDPGDTVVGHIALDYQPFLVEVMVAHLHEAVLLEEPYQDLPVGERYFCRGNNVTMIFIEIANPFDVPIALGDYRLTVFGSEDPADWSRTVRLSGVLQPRQSRVFYSIPDQGDPDAADVPITVDKEAWEMLFLAGAQSTCDIRDPENTCTASPDHTWPANRLELEGARLEADTDRSIQIERFDEDFNQWYVVDRIDVLSQGDTLFADQVDDIENSPASWYNTPAHVAQQCTPDPSWNLLQPSEHPHAIQWVRASRGWDLEPALEPGEEFDSGADYFVPADQRGPRYVFGLRNVEVTVRTGSIFPPSPGVPIRRTLTPEAPEAVQQPPRHTAAFFDQSEMADDPGQFEPEVGYFPRPRFGRGTKVFEYREWVDGEQVVRERVFDGDGRLAFALRMNLKKFPDGIDFGPDFNHENLGFEQIGELLNVFLFGHELEFDEQTGDYRKTRTTFAEFMIDSELNGMFDVEEEFDVTETESQNRIVNCWRMLINNQLSSESGDEEAAEAIQQCIEWLTESDAHRINRLRTRPWMAEVTEFDEGGEEVTRERVVGGLLNRPYTPWELEAMDLLPDGFNLVDYRLDPRHARPALPAGLLLLDAFVCDGPGQVWKVVNGDDVEWYDFFDNELTDEQVQQRRLFNANDFAGSLTPGLININTATPEVMRAMPHMLRLVHEDWDLAQNPWSQVPWAIQRYRERFGPPDVQTNVDGGPAFSHRGRNVRDPEGRVVFRSMNFPIEGLLPGMRGDRGMASIGELMLLTQPARFNKELYFDGDPETGVNRYRYLAGQEGAILDHASWRIDYPALRDRTRYITDVMQPDPTAVYTGIHPQVHLFPAEVPADQLPLWMEWQGYRAQLSTDVQDRIRDAFDAGQEHGSIPDELLWPETAEDAREAALLFSGISNIVTTRSDVFTVYFRVRSFRQNPTTGVWDATDREHIVDDARYVMLIDRSEVNRPSDRPKILYLERLPN